MNISKKFWLLIFLILTKSFWVYSQSSYCSDLKLKPICGSITNVPSAQDTGFAQNGPNYGCLSSQPNPSWYFLQAASTDTLRILLSQYTGPNQSGSQIDIDYIIWGPFHSPIGSCDSLFGDKIASCSFSPDAIEIIKVDKPVSGKYYILLITNYSNTKGYYNLTTISGATNCDVGCQFSLGADTFFCSHSSLTLTAQPLPGSNFSQYTWYRGSSTNFITNTTHPVRSIAIPSTQPGRYIVKATGYDSLLKFLCTAWDTIEVTATIAPPDTPKIDTICVGSSARLILNDLKGHRVYWYRQSGTNWVVLDSVNNYFVTIDSTTVFGVRWRAPNGCMSDMVPFTVVAYPIVRPPTVIAAPGVCIGQSSQMIAQSLDTIHWFSNTFSSTILHRGDTFRSPVLATSTTYYVSSRNNKCYSTRVAVPIAVSSKPPRPKISPQNSYCIADTAIVYTDRASNCTLRWYETAPNLILYDTVDTLKVFYRLTTTPIVVSQVLNGCESDRDTLTFRGRKLDSISVNICQGENYRGFVTSGRYYQRYSQHSINLCDSLFITNLIVKDTVQTQLNIQSCPTAPVWFNGAWRSTSGIYRDTLVAANGCDSFVVLNLSISNSLITNLEQTICRGDSITFDGKTLINSGIYRDTLSSYRGCDSIVILNLTVLDTSLVKRYRSGCAGTSQTFDIHTLDTTGVYTSVYLKSNGCDSTIQMYYTRLDTHVRAEYIQICENKSLIYHGNEYRSAGIYTIKLTNQYGCDSTIYLYLTNHPVVRNQYTKIICQGQSYQGYTTSGVYVDTFEGKSVRGCDSIRTLNLIVNPTLFSTETKRICYRDTFRGYYESGEYISVLVSRFGCDSIHTLSLTVIPDTLTQNQTICSNSEYMGYSKAGIYHDTITTAEGCKQRRTLILHVDSISESDITQTICYGDQYLGHSSSGYYIDTLVNSKGCDSIHRMTLIVKPKILIDSISDIVVCGGWDTLVQYDSSLGKIRWSTGDTTPYTRIDVGGIYTLKVTRVDGCSEIDTFWVSFENLPDINLTYSAPFYYPGEIVTISSNLIIGNYKWRYGQDSSVCRNCPLYRPKVKKPDWVHLEYLSPSKCQVNDSIYLTVIEGMVAGLPTAFSPNRDSVNSVWKLAGTNVSEIDIKVYNRWGEIVFYTADVDFEWDGSYKGQPLPVGVYYVLGYYKDIRGTEFKIQQSLNIIK